MRVGSGPVKPSVSVDSYTASESIPATTTVGDRSVPPSIDQPKKLTTPKMERCARGVLGKKIRKRDKSLVLPWTRYTRALEPTSPERLHVVKNTPAGGVDDVFDLGNRRRRGRVTKVKGLRRILEKKKKN